MNASSMTSLDSLRWTDNGSPFFEVYYLRFHDPKQRLAGWFRVVLRTCREKVPDVSFWATLFDLEQPDNTVHLHRTFPLRQARLNGEGNGLQSESCGFSRERWWGQLSDQTQEIDWDFTVEGIGDGFLHLLRPLYDWNFVPMKVLSPQFRAGIGGHVSVRKGGGETRKYRFEQLLGNASHYWGKRLVEHRVWGFCQNFEEDPDFGFEGASGIAYFLGMPLPRTTFLCFRFNGKLYEYKHPIRTLLNRSHHDLLSWQFEAQGGGLKFVGEAQASAVQNMVAHRWESPDGRPEREQYIHLDSTADMSIQVYERVGSGWQLIHRVSANRMAAFETSAPRLDGRVEWVER